MTIKMITFVLPNLDPMGGQQTQALNLVKCLKAEIDFNILSFGQDSTLAPAFIKEGAKVFIPDKNLLSLTLPAGKIYYLENFIKSHHTDLIMVWNPFYGTEWALLSNLKTNVPTILMIQNLTSQEIYDLPETERTITQQAIHFADAYISCSNNATEDLIKTFKIPKKQITMIPNIGSCSLEPNHKKLNKIPERTVTAVGRICPQKNTQFFIEIANQILQKYPDVKFFLIGDAQKSQHKYKQKIKKLIAEYGIEESVTITGWLPKEEVTNYLKQSMIYISTSNFEGSSLTLQEAMHCGCAIIASDVGDSAYQLNNAGIVIPSQNLKLFVEALELLLSQPKKIQFYYDSIFKHCQHKIATSFYGKEYLDKLKVLTFPEKTKKIPSIIQDHILYSNSWQEYFKTSCFGSLNSRQYQIAQKVVKLWHTKKQLILYGTGIEAAKIVDWLHSQNQLSKVKEMWDDYSITSVHNTFFGNKWKVTSPYLNLPANSLIIITSKQFLIEMTDNLVKYNYQLHHNFITINDLAYLMTEDDYPKYKQVV